MVKRNRLSLPLAAAALLLLGGGAFLLWGPPPGPPPPERPAAVLVFAFVDVARSVGYTMRNRTGRDYAKNFIIEAMPPGIAVADFDGDGWMDLYCPNGNDIRSWDPALQRITLLPPDEAPRNELYWNQKGTFVPGGKAAGVDDQSWAFGALAGDVDNDGDPDLYVCNWGLNLLYLNNGDGTFREAGGPAGVAGDPRGWATGACFFDYDRDGDLDLYVCQYADMYAFFLDPGQVRINPDGSLDGRSCDWKGLRVYCGPLGLLPQNDVFFHNMLVETGELKFEDRTRQLGFWLDYDARSTKENSAGPFYAFQPVAWDIDGDGWLDLFVANDSVDNTCWMNLEGKSFENPTPEMQLARSQSDYFPQASMGVAVGDVNNDGLFDILITEFSHDQFNVLLCERLPHGRAIFTEKAPNVGLRDMTFFKLGWGVNLLDPDCDADLDVFFACGHVFPEVDDPRFDNQQTKYRQGNLFVLNRDARRLKVEDVSGRAGSGIADIYKCSRASVLVDFDNDGDYDIATTELNDSPCLLRCDRAPDGRRWLMVRLVGDPKRRVPRDPAGAVVTVKAGDLVRKRVLLLGSSFQSSEDPRLHFGLGDAARIDEVEVLWPNGEVTTLRDVALDSVVTIDQSKG